MAITHSQSEQARLASAAFARNLFKGAPLAFIQQALVDGGMSFAQAERFATDYAVLHQFDDLHGTGFSATVFEREGVKYLAIRGLEPLGLNFASGIDWVETGYEDIVKEGIAAVQGVALLNYIQRLCAPEDADDVVQYTYSPLTKAFGISSTAAKGLGVLTGTSPITVTGHSAGGHLAVIMSRLAPSLVSSVYTFNAPGFNSVTPGNLFPLLSDGFFAGLVGTGAVPVTGPIGGAWNPGVMNHLVVEGEPFHVVGDMPGEQVVVFSEGATQAVIPTLGQIRDAHSIAHITDALAIYSLFAQIRPSLDSVAGFGLITAFLEAASNRHQASVEISLDALRRLFRDPEAASLAASTAFGDRNQFYANLYDAGFRSRVAALAGTLSIESLITASVADLLDEVTGPEALAYRYALRELNHFVVKGNSSLYDRHNVHGELTPYDSPANSPAGMTSAFLNDRAKYLAWSGAANLIDATAQAGTDVDDARYIDLRQQHSLLVTGTATSSPASPARLLVFGSEIAEALQGGARADSLYAGSGTDFLQGGGDNDYLEGGMGRDVYVYTASESLLGSLTNDGADDVLDTDGKGVIRYKYTEVGLTSDTIQTHVIGGLGVRVSDTEWQSADGKFTYSQQFAGLEASINGDAGGSVFLRGFDFAAAQNQDFLGIRLVEEQSGPASPVRAFIGDKENWDSIPATPEIDPVGDGFGNYVRADGQDGRPDISLADRADTFLGSSADEVERFDTAGGNDVVRADGPDSFFSSAGGRDIVLAGEGSDLVEAGGNDDWVEGGAGDDILGGNAGDDVIWADSSSIDNSPITLAQAITTGNTAVAILGQGELLTGDDGADRLVGASTSDLLLGGAGVDIIVGGGGDDNIYGDASVSGAAHGWTANRSVTANGTSIIYLLTTSGVTVSGPNELTTGDADYIYGGAGADWIFAGAGDDYVEGGDTLDGAGTPDDVVFGEAGSDILLGGSGADTLFGDSASVDAEGLSGDDYLDGGAGIDFLFGGGGNDILFGGESGDQLFGNDGDDILVGERGNDLLVGGAGKDTYVYHRGDGVDTIQDSGGAADASVLVVGPGITWLNTRFRPGSLMVDFGDGDQVHFEGFNPDEPASTRALGVIQFSDGDFKSFEDILARGFDIDGTFADDEIYGTAVTDRILAGDGHDYVQAKAGDDTVDGGIGDDEIYAGEGNDTVTAGDGADFVDAAGGDDTIDGGLGDDTLEGGGGADVISGGEGQDLIFGDAGDDVLNGDGGDDTLEGGSGNDTLTGGAGTDAYVLYAGMGSDTVTDGEGGEANVLQLGAGLSLDSLGTGRVGDDLVVRLRGLKDAVTITDYYTRAQDWVVRDMAGVETDLETVINQPDPYAGDYIARLWADTRLGSIAQVHGRAYAIGWTPVDGDTFESYYERAYLGVVRETINSTYIRVDPPHDILAQTSTASTSSTVETFTGFSSPTFHWLLNSFEPSYLESDDGFFQAPLGQLPQTQASGQAVLTLKRDRQLTNLNYQSSSFPGPITQVPYDTGDGTVEALVTSQILHESYNEFADVTRVNPDTTAWAGQVNDVFGNRVLADVTRIEDHYLSVRELRGGASDNFIFASTAGLVFPLVTLIDGGAGNDTLQGDGALLYGNAGDDELRGADTILIGGDGNDTVTGWGGSIFVHTATEVGVDTVADIAFYGEAYLDWYYESLEVADWRESAEVGGKYRAEFGDEESGGGVEYYDTLEEAQDEGGSNITFIEPLPSIAPVVKRGDAEALAALEDAGVLKRDVVRFGPGLTLDDLDLTVTVLGARADQYPGDPLQVGGTLAVRWGSGAGFDVEVPDANYGLIGDDLFAMVTHPQGGFTYPAYQDYRLGLGVELFEFADGATYSLEEVLQQAGIVLDYGYDFERGTGSQTIEQEWLSVDFAPDIAPSDLYFVFGSIDMRFGVIGDSAFGIIPRWYGNVFETPQIEFRFADGTVYDPDTVTRMGRTYTGSEFGDALTADFFFSSALIGNGGDDFLGGRQGNDLLDGGPGHDFLSGAEGNDIYAFGYDSEVDSIYDYEPQRNGLDTVRFRDDVLPGDVSVAREYDTLKVYLAGSSAELWINGWFLQEGGSTEAFVFADGTTWDAAAIETLLPQPIATSGDDQLFGFTGGDTLDGLDGDDEIHGFAGHDTLRGGPGDDLLGGDAGDDVYEFGPGDGHDLVFDRRGFNTVSFGPGIEASEAVVTRDDYNLYIVVDEGRGRVGIVDWFWQAEAKIAQATFADGTTWDAAELESRVAQVPATEFDDIIWATDGVDVVDGLAGDDAVYGRGGDDILDGGDGADELRAGSGHNIVRGGAGDDYLDAQAGHSVLEGSVGNDHLYYDGRGIAIGGAGDDLIEVFGHNGVVAFNPGDGADTVYATTQFTLSLGGGIGPSDLSLAIDGPDLVVSVGAQDSVRLTNDDGGPGSWPLVLLQLFGSAHIYNFSAVIDELYTRNAADPSVTELALGDVLPGYLFISSETGALGGIIAHQYATRGSIAHVPDEDLLPVLQDPQFGANFQSTEYAGSNSAPLLESPLADATVSEDSAFAYQVPTNAFSDPDEGDLLSYSAALAGGSGLPAWLSFDAETGSFSGTPLQADVGAAAITVTVTDSAGLSAQDTFTITVENVNDAPVVAVPLPDVSFEAQTPFSFGVPAGTFADEDPGDSLDLSGTLFGGVALPAWLAFDPATATFAGSPATADIGVYHLQVTATDAAGALAASDFGLVVHAVAGSEVDGTAGDDVLYGGTGDETLSAKGGNDYLYGDVGNDLLKGDDGQDVLQGGEGADVLRAGKGEDVLDGGAGDDLIFGGTGSSLIVGGIGNDTIRTRSGSDLILFNRGDGMDTVIADGAGDNTLSFGGGIRYSDLTLSRDGKDLIVDAGGGDGLVLRNWYANKQSVLNLQIILDASDEFDASSSDPLYNKKVQTFDFQGMVGAFDSAYAQSPGLGSWAITNALLAFHLSAVDDFALGGDLAYWYGKKNSFAGISLAAAQQVIGAAGFGSDAQSLRPFSGLQEGFVKLA